MDDVFLLNGLFADPAGYEVRQKRKKECYFFFPLPNRSFCEEGVDEDGFCEDPVEYPQDLVQALLDKIASGQGDTKLNAFFDGGSAGNPPQNDGRRRKKKPNTGGFGGGGGGGGGDGGGGGGGDGNRQQQSRPAQPLPDFEPR